MSFCANISRTAKTEDCSGRGATEAISKVKIYFHLGTMTDGKCSVEATASVAIGPRQTGKPWLRYFYNIVKIYFLLNYFY